MRKSRIASRCCCLASRYCRIAGVADADICLSLAVRGATPSAFERRCIPAGCVAPLSNITDILGRRALPAGRLAVLGATMDLHHGLRRMKVLALDTTTRVGSVALVENDRVIEERNGDDTRSHAERLPHELLAVANANGVALSAIDVFAVASGPGSFTGLRIGIATIQGLALVARRRVIGVPALDALAHLASLDLDAGAFVAAWMDAHRRDVFAALYRVTAAPPFDPARLEELDSASAGDPGSVLTRWQRFLVQG